LLDRLQGVLRTLLVRDEVVFVTWAGLQITAVCGISIVTSKEFVNDPAELFVLEILPDVVRAGDSPVVDSFVNGGCDAASLLSGLLLAS
jgi:hypothetical protein